MLIKSNKDLVSNSINLADVELYDAANVMLPRQQLSFSLSTTYYGYPDYAPNQCNDGNLYTICHTGNAIEMGDNQPWLRIDYNCVGGSTSLSRVLVINRDGCCQERIMDYQMEFLNVAGVADMATYRFASVQPTYNIPVVLPSPPSPPRPPPWPRVAGMCQPAGAHSANLLLLMWLVSIQSCVGGLAVV